MKRHLFVEGKGGDDSSWDKQGETEGIVGINTVYNHNHTHVTFMPTLSNPYNTYAYNLHTRLIF
jgi:hypothetical protein